MSVEFAEQMYRQALQLSIKTVPFYYLSTFGNTIFQPCLLFAQDTPIIQSKPRKWTILNNFFSGAYKIVGFTHTISTKSAESEFYLQKNTMSNTTKKQEEEIAFEGKGMFEIAKEESEVLVDPDVVPPQPQPAQVNVPEDPTQIPEELDIEAIDWVDESPVDQFQQYFDVGGFLHSPNADL